MANSYIFGQGTPWSYEQLQNKRKVAEQLMQGMSRAPRNVGEGLNAIGDALLVRQINKKAAAEEQRMREEAQTAFSGLMGGQPGLDALMSAAGNPMLMSNPGQAMVVESLLGRALAPPPEPPKPTDDIREFMFAQENPAFGEWLEGQRRAGATNVTTTVGGDGNSGAFTKKADEAAVGRFNDYVVAGQNAQRMMGDLQALADLGTQIETGKGAEIKAALGPYAQMLGIEIDGLSEVQAYQSIIDKMVPLMRPAGSGPASDFDGRQFLSSLPNLSRTPEGNRIIQDTLQALQQHQIAAAQLAHRAFLSPEHPEFLPWQEAERMIMQLGNPYEAFSEFRKTVRDNPPPADAPPPAANVAPPPTPDEALKIVDEILGTGGADVVEPPPPRLPSSAARRNR